MVRVKHRGTSATVPAAGVSTIGKMRIMIREALDLPSEGGALRIIHQGRELSDPMQTLEAAGVTDASTVMVSFQDTPGGPPVGGWGAVRGPLESVSRSAKVQSAKVHAKLSVSSDGRVGLSLQPKPPFGEKPQAGHDGAVYGWGYMVVVTTKDMDTNLKELYVMKGHSEEQGQEMIDEIRDGMRRDKDLPPGFRIVRADVVEPCDMVVSVDEHGKPQIGRDELASELVAFAGPALLHWSELGPDRMGVPMMGSQQEPAFAGDTSPPPYDAEAALAARKQAEENQHEPGEPLVGQPVIIHGLASRPELNGKKGIVTQWLPSKGRYEVTLARHVEHPSQVNPVYASSAKKMAVKPANLRVNPKMMVVHGEVTLKRGDQICAEMMAMSLPELVSRLRHSETVAHLGPCEVVNCLDVITAKAQGRQIYENCESAQPSSQAACDARAELMSLGAYKAVVHALLAPAFEKERAANSMMYGWGTGCILLLSSDEGTEDPLIEAGALQALVQAVTAYPLDLAMDVAQCTSNLCFGRDKRGWQRKQQGAEAGLIEVLVSTMKTVSPTDKTEAKVKILQALGQLTLGERSPENPFSSDRRARAHVAGAIRTTAAVLCSDPEALRLLREEPSINFIQNVILFVPLYKDEFLAAGADAKWLEWDFWN